jgi:hypothetical protein
MTAYVYDVHVEMLHPVRASIGDRLIVTPGHERPVVVVRRVHGTWEPVRVGPPNYGAIVGLEADGAVTQRYPVYATLSAELAAESA